MKEKVTRIRTSLQHNAMLLRTKVGGVIVRNIEGHELLYIHSKTDGRDGCLKKVEEALDCRVLWSVLEASSWFSQRITVIEVLSLQEENRYVANVQFELGGPVMMVPSTAIALALTKGRLNKDFDILIDKDLVVAEEARMKEEAKKVRELKKLATNAGYGFLFSGGRPG